MTNELHPPDLAVGDLVLRWDNEQRCWYSRFAGPVGDVPLRIFPGSIDELVPQSFLPAIVGFCQREWTQLSHLAAGAMREGGWVLPEDEVEQTAEQMLSFEGIEIEYNAIDMTGRLGWYAGIYLKADVLMEHRVVVYVSEDLSIRGVLSLQRPSLADGRRPCGQHRARARTTRRLVEREHPAVRIR